MIFVEHQARGGGTVLDVDATNELNNGCFANEKNDPFVALPLLAQQSFANEPACSAADRAMMAEKILASLAFTEPGFTDAINMAGISH